MGRLTWTKGPWHADRVQGPEQSRFRPTVVAAPPIAQPPLLRTPEAVLVSDDYLDVGVPDVGEPLPADFALQELLEMDLADPQAILDVSRTVGRVCDPSPGTFRYLPASETWRGPFDDVLAQTVAYATSAGVHPRSAVSVEAVRLHLRAARAATRHMLAYLTGDDDGILAAWPLEGYNQPRSLSMAWGWWLEHLNAGLAPFRMYVAVTRPDGRETSGAEVAQPTLYSAVCLQLAQYLATEARVLTCANDRCRRPFTQQRTSASRRRNADQFHVAGVRYCSRACLKRKSEADRRRRIREGKGSS